MRIGRRGTIKPLALAAHAHHVAFVHGLSYYRGPATMYPSHWQYYRADAAVSLGCTNTLPASHHPARCPTRSSRRFRTREHAQRAPPMPPFIVRWLV